MRYILRKYVDAPNATAALKLDKSTPVHDIYLKDGEEPKRDTTPKDLIGFWMPDANDLMPKQFATYRSGCPILGDDQK